MTALAMIIGMIPMALGLGEGGEQNAPLGRAVIGGLLCATVATLFFVPAVFSIFHGRRSAQAPSTAPYGHTHRDDAEDASRLERICDVGMEQYDDSITRRKNPKPNSKIQREMKATVRASGSPLM